jgi:hypothetical protein
MGTSESLEDSNYEGVSGTFPGSSITGLTPNARFFGLNRYDTADITLNTSEGKQTIKGLEIDANSTAPDQSSITALSGGSPSNGWLAMYKGIPYVYYKD